MPKFLCTAESVGDLKVEIEAANAEEARQQFDDMLNSGTVPEVSGSIENEQVELLPEEGKAMETVVKESFEQWFARLDQLCMDMFLNSWEELGMEEIDARQHFAGHNTPQNVCNELMFKYGLDDCRRM